MKTVLKISLICLVVALALSFGEESHAYTKQQIEEALNYEEHVPDNMRELVSEEKYKKTVQKLALLDDPLSGEDMLSLRAIMKVAASPCSGSMVYLATEYANSPATQKALTKVNKGFQEPPFGYETDNPWIANENATELVRQMLNVFSEWCVFLPEIDGDQDNGLYYIQYFAWFYYNNLVGKAFVQGRDRAGKTVPLKTGLKFVEDFSVQRGNFMNSKASTKQISQWVNDPRLEMEDYKKTKAGEYDSWNDFFAREIKVDKENKTIPSRPATMPISEYPERDYIVVAPTDCIVNPLVQVLQKEGASIKKYVDNPLQEDMVLDVKNIPIGLMVLLGDAPEELKNKFIGGTGLSCVLMPNTYHHFHSPVNGKIVHAEIVKSVKLPQDTKKVPISTYGYVDFPNWVPLDGNVGRPGTDFSEFQFFQRGVVIIEVKYKDVDGKADLTGYVASIPVGLDTIGSVVLDDDIKEGKFVKRGFTRLGGFLYGGSLDILLFSKGLATGAVQTRMGNQITLFNIGKTPPPPHTKGWRGK